MTTIEAGLLVMLVGLPLVSSAAAVILVHAARQHPPIRALTERATVAVLATAAGWVIGLLAANALLRWVELERPWSTLLVILAQLLFSAPGPIFVWLYATGRLRDE